MEPLLRRLRPHWVTLDCVAAVVIGLAFSDPSQMPGPPRLAALAVVCVANLPAGVRRVWPGAALGLVVAGTACATALSGRPGLPVAVAFVMYLAPVRYPRREALLLLGGALMAQAAGLAGFALIPHGAWGPGGFRAATGLLAEGWLLVGGSWVIGYTVRQQRAYSAGVREQAARSAREELARARQASTAERLRIARELHDVVAHSLSLIAVQAGVANWVVRSQPAEAARALSSIEEISRGALGEMRALLGVLRLEPDGADVSESSVSSAPVPSVSSVSSVLAPAPGLADLGELAGRFAGAGLRVEVEVRAPGRVSGRVSGQVSAGVDLAAYRVIQEAVTNVVKHAGTDHCRVSVSYREDALLVEVADQGRGVLAWPGSSGHGLAGMRERVAMYGGEFGAGPGPAGGFVVTARFPLGPGTGSGAAG